MTKKEMEQAVYTHVLSNLIKGVYVLGDGEGVIKWGNRTQEAYEENNYLGSLTMNNERAWDRGWDRATADYKEIANTPLLKALE